MSYHTMITGRKIIFGFGINKGFNSVLLTMDRKKSIINSEQISRTITSRRDPENQNQVKLHKICY